jgi:hypothetical protein
VPGDVSGPLDTEPFTGSDPLVVPLLPETTQVAPAGSLAVVHVSVTLFVPATTVVGLALNEVILGKGAGVTVTVVDARLLGAPPALGHCSVAV